jgi:GNAT superfamily N-acetyltransferase
MYFIKQLFYHLANDWTIFKEQGARAGLAQLGRVIWRVFYQHDEYVVLTNLLSGPNQISPPKSRPDLVIRQVTTPEELDALQPIADVADIARFHHMFKRGSIMFIAFQHEIPVGYCWISAEIDRTANRIQPPLHPGEACVHDLFVAPAYRNQGIGQALISHRLQFLQKHGYQRAIVAVLKGNTPALKADERAGYIYVGQMWHTRILFWDSLTYQLCDS